MHQAKKQRLREDRHAQWAIRDLAADVAGIGVVGMNPVGPAILSGSWSIASIAEYQHQTTWAAWVQPLGLVLAIVGLIGKLKREPFDIPKAKSEVGAGPLTEFSGRKLALWSLSVQIKTVVGMFLLVNVFMGGAAYEELGLSGSRSADDDLRAMIDDELVAQHRARMDEFVDLAVDRVIAFHSTLTAEQKEKLAGKIEKFHRYHGRGFE